jgi:phosphotransacetylase
MLYDEALEKMHNRDFFGVMMVETGEADAFLSGFSSRYAETIRPALQIVGTNNTMKHIAGNVPYDHKKGTLLFCRYHRQYPAINQNPGRYNIACCSCNQEIQYRAQDRHVILFQFRFDKGR